jgi:hypothetical protein
MSGAETNVVASVEDGRRDSSPDSQQPNTPDLRIPEARDAFFGYNEEKVLQHVRTIE